MNIEKLLNDPGRIRDRIKEKNMQLEMLQAISSPMTGEKVKKSLDADTVPDLAIKRQQVFEEIRELEKEYLDAKKALYLATSELPALQGYIIMLIYGGHMTAEQIAARLGKSKGYIYEQKAAGIKALDARARG